MLVQDLGLTDRVHNFFLVVSHACQHVGPKPFTNIGLRIFLRLLCLCRVSGRRRHRHRSVDSVLFGARRCWSTRRCVNGKGLAQPPSLPRIAAKWPIGFVICLVDRGRSVIESAVRSAFRNTVGVRFAALVVMGLGR